MLPRLFAALEGAFLFFPFPLQHPFFISTNLWIHEETENTKDIHVHIHHFSFSFLVSICIVPSCLYFLIMQLFFWFLRENITSTNVCSLCALGLKRTIVKDRSKIILCLWVFEKPRPIDFLFFSQPRKEKGVGRERGGAGSPHDAWSKKKRKEVRTPIGTVWVHFFSLYFHLSVRCCCSLVRCRWFVVSAFLFLLCERPVHIC